MDLEKRKIIINEIEQWRRSRLLPEHYCDFLLNLYLDDPTQKPKSVLGFSTSAIQNSHWKVWFLIFGCVGIISYFLLNFNSFQIPLQISISALFILTCFMVGGVQRNKSMVVSYLCFGLGAGLLLYLGLFFMQRYDASSALIIGYVALCSIIWMVTGILARMAVFHLSGWVVLLLIYGWFLQQNITNIDWIGLQMGWLPIGIVLCWLGWLFHHNNKQIGTVLLVIGFLVWFIPEIYGNILTDLSRDVLQSSLIIKIIVAGIVSFTLRKKWIEWVA
jgi:hypothetical protein